MSKLEKQISKLCAKPPPADFTWDELCSLLSRLGYQLMTGKGSRRKFYNKERDLLIICHEPHPKSVVDRGCVVDVVAHLIDNGLIQGE